MQDVEPTTGDNSSDPLPLSGIRVLDVASFIAAPVAATVLGDYGADVIKVEPPREGDPNRTISVVASGYPKSPVNYPWHLDSRGKRSLAIDLKNERARIAFDRVIACSDVLITNYPLATRARLRLDYEDVAKANPRLIYTSFTGYGETGPDCDQHGFDLNAYFARSGILDGARYDGGVPAVTMPAQGDRATGLGLAAAIMIALWHRQRTGRGTKVSSSLFANGIWANGNAIQAALVGAPLPARPPPDRPRSALTNAYRTRDDRWIQFTVVEEDRDWLGICRAIERPETWPRIRRFADVDQPPRQLRGLAAILRDTFVTRDFAEWRGRLEGASHRLRANQPSGRFGRRRAGRGCRRHRAYRTSRHAAHHSRAVLAAGRRGTAAWTGPLARGPFRGNSDAGRRERRRDRGPQSGRDARLSAPRLCNAWAVAASAGKKASRASSDRVMSIGVPNTVVVEKNDSVPASVTN